MIDREAIETIETVLKKGRKVQIEYNKKADQLKILEMKLHLVDCKKGDNNEI